MDSPLLPTHRQRPFDGPSSLNVAEDPSLLADLTIKDDDDSFLPSSPVRPPSSRSQTHPYQLGRDDHSNEASSSRPSARTGQAFQPRRQVSSSSSQSISRSSSQASANDDTPKKPSGRQATWKPRFSLFAPPRPPSAEGADGGSRQEEDNEELGDAGGDEEDGGDEEMGGDQTIHAGAGSSQSGNWAKSSEDREEKLRESLYELRRMNEVFDGFLSALEAARGHNEVNFHINEGV